MLIIALETSGAYPDKHGILSLGAIEFENPDNAFYEECRLDDSKVFDQNTVQFHGFSELEARDSKKKSVKELLQSFLEWMQSVKEKTFAAHNTPFDWKFLEWEFRSHNFLWPFNKRSLDIHGWVFYHQLKRGIRPITYNGTSALGLKKILEYVGIRDPRTTHNALEDAKLEAECFHRLIFGKPLFEDYADQEVPKYL